jgi:hypothetical protein
MKKKLSVTSSVVTELKKGVCQANDPLWLTLWVAGSSQKDKSSRGKNN